MNFLFALFPGLAPYRILIELAIVAAAVAAFLGWLHVHDNGVAEAARNEVRAEWNAEKLAQREADLQAARENAIESKRRMALQERNQREQNAELARARADADRNARERDRVRDEYAAAAEQWRAAGADPAAGADLAAAADAIRVCTDVLGRADRRASLLAEVADARGAAGLKCERDYDALTPAAASP